MRVYKAAYKNLGCSIDDERNFLYGYELYGRQGALIDLLFSIYYFLFTFRRRLARTTNHKS